MGSRSRERPRRCRISRAHFDSHVVRAVDDEHMDPLALANRCLLDVDSCRGQEGRLPRGRPPRPHRSLFRGRLHSCPNEERF